MKKIKEYVVVIKNVYMTSVPNFFSSFWSLLLRNLWFHVYAYIYSNQRIGVINVGNKNLSGRRTRKIIINWKFGGFFCWLKNIVSGSTAVKSVSLPWCIFIKEKVGENHCGRLRRLRHRNPNEQRYILGSSTAHHVEEIKKQHTENCTKTQHYGSYSYIRGLFSLRRG